MIRRGSSSNEDSPEKKFGELFDQMYSLCEENDWGDPFNYARAREIYLANLLGHKIADTFSGGDAWDDKGECEYKTTTTKSIKGTYTGISVKETWEEQEKYIVEDKIGKYHNHYCARFEGSKVVEIWKLKYDDVLKVLLPKIKKSYEKGKYSNPADPRIGVSLSATEIKKNGEKIYPK